jgi:hypothetical protein
VGVWVPFAVASFSRVMGSSFGGASTTGVLGSNFPPVILIFLGRRDVMRLRVSRGI